jgi:hypothetical protein
MTTQTSQFKVGDKVIYRTVDMEHYSRGYGIAYEIKVAKIVSVCYTLDNGDTVEETRLTPAESKPQTANLETSPSETPKLLSNFESLLWGQKG